MASQALLEAQLADLRARLAVLQDKYDKLTDETPDYIPNQAAIIEARALKSEQIQPLIKQIDQTTTELNDLLKVGPTEELTITSQSTFKDKPIVSAIDDSIPAAPTIEAPPIDIRIPIQDTTGLDEGPQIPNPIDTTGLDEGPQIPGLQGPKNETVAQQTRQDAENAKTQDDWRVRLSLAPNADYLYKATDAGILEYLKDTDGVVFPYLPQIQVTYAANYETSDIVHSNYKMIQYKNSAVDQITITGDFTAQDTYEANYLLAVIHFFKSVTKMFYGKDQIPKPGTPPPLCYLSGLGDFQFDRHPLVISSFNYSLPNDVDYIRASSPTLPPGSNSSAYNTKGGRQNSGDVRRGILNVGAVKSPAKFGTNKATNTQPTYVPTKMSIVLTAFPMVTRNDISNNFSVKKYATGALLQGSKNASGGGIW
jgi:hypothetical protein